MLIGWKFSSTDYSYFLVDSHWKKLHDCIEQLNWLRIALNQLRNGLYQSCEFLSR